MEGSSSSLSALDSDADVAPDSGLLIAHVLRTVWEDFHAWKADYTLVALNGLTRPHRVAAEGLFEDSAVPDWNPPSSPASEKDDISLTSSPTPSSPEAPGFLKLGTRPSSCTSRTLPFSSDLFAPSQPATPLATLSEVQMSPYPPYEACAPLARNKFVGDDADDMAFIPFADDPAFDQTADAEHYGHLAWANPAVYINPDDQRVVAEAARRLAQIHGMSFADVDATGFLPFKLCSDDKFRGLLHKATLWDKLPWLLDSPHPNDWTSHPIPEPTNLRARVASAVRYFCPNPNCLEPYCSVHPATPEMPAHTTSSGSLVSTFSLAVFRESGHTPCGETCCLYHGAATLDDARHADGLREEDSRQREWLPPDVDTIRLVLQLDPGAAPCEIAVICRRKCEEVFQFLVASGAYHRSAAPTNFSEYSVVTKGATTAKPSSKPKLRFQRVHIDFQPNSPCDHPGPCRAGVGCACFSNDAHCERGCRCSTQCERRWKGCDCHSRSHSRGAAQKSERKKGIKKGNSHIVPVADVFVEDGSVSPSGDVPESVEDVEVVEQPHMSDALCRTESCRCFASYKECDPERCGKCNARDACGAADEHSPDGCWNVQLQCGRRKACKVRQSKWGLGLYIVESALAGELITEYTGEVIYEATVGSRENVAKHRRRNYVFQLDTALSVDAAYAGNESRFINHAPPPRANCRPQMMLVNGDHRMGIYARRDIPPGAELLIDYGPEYFSPKKNKGKKERRK